MGAVVVQGMAAIDALVAAQAATPDLPTDVLLLTVPDVAKAFRLAESTVYELLAAGQLPSIQIGKSRRVPVTALRAWIAERLEAARQAQAAGPALGARAVMGAMR